MSQYKSGYSWADLYESCLAESDFSIENQIKNKEILIKNDKCKQLHNKNNSVESIQINKSNINSNFNSKIKSKTEANRKKRNRKKKNKTLKKEDPVDVILDELIEENQLEYRKHLEKMLLSNAVVEKIAYDIESEQSVHPEQHIYKIWICMAMAVYTVAMTKNREQLLTDMYEKVLTTKDKSVPYLHDQEYGNVVDDVIKNMYDNNTEMDLFVEMQQRTFGYIIDMVGDTTMAKKIDDQGVLCILKKLSKNNDIFKPSFLQLKQSYFYCEALTQHVVNNFIGGVDQLKKKGFFDHLDPNKYPVVLVLRQEEIYDFFPGKGTIVSHYEMVDKELMPQDLSKLYKSDKTTTFVIYVLFYSFDPRFNLVGEFRKNKKQNLTYNFINFDRRNPPW